MAKFRVGGVGPDGGGLGKVAGIPGRRFDIAGEIYETEDTDEIRALRECPYVVEISGDRNDHEDGKVADHSSEKDHRCTEEELERLKMRELVKLGRGLYQIGMTKRELISLIMEQKN